MTQLTTRRDVLAQYHDLQVVPTPQDIDPLREWMVVIWRWYAHQNPHW